MGFWFFVLICVLLMPSAMIICGKYFIKTAPKKINFVFGYRTSMSMKNDETWVFAHRHFGKIWYFCGLIMFPISLLLMLLIINCSNDFIGTIGIILCTVQMIPIVFSIVSTEKALRKNFGKDGNRL